MTLRKRASHDGFWEFTRSRSLTYWVGLGIFVWVVPGWVIWIPALLLFSWALDRRLKAWKNR